jgi:hypothetical protein
MKTSSRVFLVALLLASGGALHAAPASSPEFGVVDQSSYVLTAWDMQTVNSAVTWAILPTTDRYLTNAEGALIGAVHVPQGALINSIELEACDASAAGGVNAFFFRSDSAGPVLLASVGTGLPDTPGCAHFAVGLAAPETVDNSFRYLVTASNETADGQTSIGAVRVFYRLQVSPAPAQATFNDVPPSDPAFQYIEALAASGITGGCGAGNYCPDAPLTRRQMAVFLSKALGLDWPVGQAP